MKKKNILYNALTLTLSALAFTGCDDFLDTMPDNRAQIDTEQKIQSLLVSAYIDHEPMTVAEFVSDNVDDFGVNNPNTDRWFDDTFAWKDESEDTNFSLNSFWESAFVSIASANQALQGIEDLGGANTPTLKECRAEALLCRAYNHFMLANMFCKHYSSTAANDLGLPYIEHPETELNPKYERGTLAELYEKIDRDLQEALPMVGDSYYTVPKYHFNTKAAYAFACRFYLYYEKWEEALKYANLCLGTQAKTMLRDWKSMAAMTQQRDAITNEYVNASSNANLLLLTGYSNIGVVFGPWASYSRYNHGQYLATNEDMSAKNIWGDSRYFHQTPKVYTGTNMDKTLFWKMPYMFEYTDPVAGIGYAHTVYPAFTTDECLLNRAEAYILLKRYNEAAEDLTTWMQNITKSTLVLTPENITTFYNAQEYSYSDEKGLNSTLKKHLNPSFAIDAEESTQEAMLQCMLGFRRIETMHAGIRWFDIKRYGIEFPRRVMNAAGVPERKSDFLSKDDKRRALQIPLKVRDAGLEANPR